MIGHAAMTGSGRATFVATSPGPSKAMPSEAAKTPASGEVRAGVLGREETKGDRPGASPEEAVVVTLTGSDATMVPSRESEATTQGLQV
jgi:hypothetical protein